MILSLIVIPTIITSLLITNQLSKEYALWDKMHNIVRLSMFDLDSLEQESTLPEVEAFFSKMQEANNLSLSLVINKAIFLESHQMGGYDHIIITDRAWIDLLEIGVETEGKGGKLIAKNDKDLPDELASFLEGQIPLWTKHNDVYPAQGLTFYEYKGMKFLALPPNVGLAGETVQAENPLVILIDGHLTDIVKTKGFLISLASSGNIVFFDEDHLQAALANSVMKSSITSINGIADVALETAQRFKQQYVYYIVAGLLIFVTMLLTAVLNGRLWAGTNGKRIFTLHTFGYPYTSIIGRF
ncbi:ABC transporter permease OS=Lysinibacillus sphaericus OX=1421 GN=LS41612_08150 PE=4 SV=1 [Lysinibacillus sphaericus]